MESIIVEVYVPAASTSYDFKLPSGGCMRDITNEIIRILETTQRNLALDHENPILCDTDRNIALNPDSTVADTGLRDSSRLILI